MRCMSCLIEGDIFFYGFRDKNQVALQEIKNVFSNYLDIIISDADILEFI